MMEVQIRHIAGSTPPGLVFFMALARQIKNERSPEAEGFRQFAIGDESW
ncbi:MAG: hypothetical protein NTX50_05575 [Candidatus Sumerlaeota bacterium]|nr:hypothetical protein [Candidatus Sumerlaeota bacterium]